MDTNILYYGDNLPILRNREYFPDNSVHLRHRKKVETSPEEA